jgi:hypothetical protein
MLVGTRQSSASLRARAYNVLQKLCLSLSSNIPSTHTLTHIQVSIITHQSRACLEPGRTKMALRRSNQSKIILQSPLAGALHKSANSSPRAGINNNHNKKTTKQERRGAHTLVVCACYNSSARHNGLQNFANRVYSHKYIKRLTLQ